MLKEYKWREGWILEDLADGYERLERPNGTIVAVITEPEDRCGSRDLAPVRDELNRLYRICSVASELAEAGEAIMELVNQSHGLVGFHLNGAKADWNEFEEIGDLEAALDRYEAANSNKQEGE